LAAARPNGTADPREQAIKVSLKQSKISPPAPFQNAHSLQIRIEGSWRLQTGNKSILVVLRISLALDPRHLTEFVLFAQRVISNFRWHPPSPP
jgi:hypothetical protein